MNALGIQPASVPIDRSGSASGRLGQAASAGTSGSIADSTNPDEPVEFETIEALLADTLRCGRDDRVAPWIAQATAELTRFAATAPPRQHREAQRIIEACQAAGTLFAMLCCSTAPSSAPSSPTIVCRPADFTGQPAQL